MFSRSFSLLLRRFSQALLLFLLFASPKVTRGEEIKGQRIYEQYCAVCHGFNGDGQGQYAALFQTKPRDFTKGLYKFKSTPSGSPPLDENLMRTIRQGVPGTAMVPQDFLSDENLHELVFYLKLFSPRLAQAKPGKPLVILPMAPSSSERISQGKLAYQKSQCAQCHGPEGKGDGILAKDLTIKPANLTHRPLKSGNAPQDIVRTILTGLDGTPMPSYQFVLEDEEIWDIAYYLDSLAEPPRETEDEKIGKKIVEEIRANSITSPTLPNKEH